VAIDLKVQMFVDPASAAWGKLRDISVSGGFLETKLKVTALSTLRMTVPALAAEGARVVESCAREGHSGCACARCIARAVPLDQHERFAGLDLEMDPLEDERRPTRSRARAARRAVKTIQSWPRCALGPSMTVRART
jgi:hypothetical protein